MLVKKVLASNF